MLGNFLTGQAGRITKPAQLQREPATPDRGALLSGRGDLLVSGIAVPSVWHLPQTPRTAEPQSAALPAG